MFCFVLVVIFRFFGSPKVGHKAREMIIREMFCSSLGGRIVVESTLDFFSSLCIHVCVCVLCVPCLI